MKIVQYELPYPPTVNTYYRRVGSRTLISKRGREYRQRVAGAVLIQGRVHFAGEIRMRIWIIPPDRRKRDLDNLLKAPLDALEKARVYDNDSQICQIDIERLDLEVTDGGGMLIEIRGV